MVSIDMKNTIWKIWKWFWILFQRYHKWMNILSMCCNQKNGVNIVCLLKWCCIFFFNFPQKQINCQNLWTKSLESAWLNWMVKQQQCLFLAHNKRDKKTPQRRKSENLRKLNLGLIYDWSKVSFSHTVFNFLCLEQKTTISTQKYQLLPHIKWLYIFYTI